MATSFMVALVIYANLWAAGCGAAHDLARPSPVTGRPLPQPDGPHRHISDARDAVGE
jgi:hypothetical protein